MTVYSDKAAYNAALAKWSEGIKVEVSKYFAAYSGDGVFTFETFHLFQSLLAWGLFVPLPAQLDYPDTPKNREVWKQNIGTFYAAMVANDLSRARPVEYVLPHPIALGDVPIFIKKKSTLFKVLQVIAVVAIIAVGAVVIAGAMSGTAAGAAASATGGTSAVATTAASGAGAVASTATTAAAATTTGAAATATASSITGAMVVAAKTGGMWVLKTAATSALGGKIAEHFQGEIAEEQQKVLKRQADAETKNMQAEIDAMNAEAARLEAQNGGAVPTSSGGFLLPVGLVLALFSFFS